MALYKHIGLSKGVKHFEWFSDDKDPLATNPYPTEYEELTFETIDATKEEEAEFTARAEARKIAAAKKAVAAKLAALDVKERLLNVNTIAGMRVAIQEILSDLVEAVKER